MTTKLEQCNFLNTCDSNNYRALDIFRVCPRSRSLARKKNDLEKNAVKFHLKCHAHVMSYSI